MSVAANKLYGSSTGSESPAGDGYSPTTPESSRRTVPSRPASFVCQRCLRLLDIYPLYTDLSQTDLDSSGPYDLLKALGRGENQKLRSSSAAPNEAQLRSSAPILADSRYGGSNSGDKPSGGGQRTAATASGRKQKTEPGIARTFSSLTNFFKSGNNTSSTPSQTPTANPAGVGATSPAKPATAIAVPARSPASQPDDIPSLIEDDDSPTPRRDDENDDEVGVLLDSSRTGSHVSPAPPPAGLPSSVSPPTSDDTRAGAKEVVRAEEDSLDDDDWAAIPNTPLLSASVSRASMRDLSRAPSLMPKRTRTKKTVQVSLVGATNDYVGSLAAKRVISMRDPINVPATYAGPNQLLASSSAAILSQPSASKSQLRRMCGLIEETIIETGLDFPLCTECSHDVLADLEDEGESLDFIIREYEAQVAILNHPYFQEEKFSKPIANLERSLARLEDDTTTIRTKLIALAEEERVLNAKGSELLVLKAEYWRQFEMHAADKEAMLENMISAHNRLTHAKKWLDLVRASHVLNDAFHVSVDLHLATIGGLRVGRLSSAQVEWPEISAALGLALHMLQEMAQKANFTFTRYRLILDGSFSGLYRLPNGGTLNLHSDGDISLVRLVQFQGVNAALFAFVECVSEFADHLKKSDPKFTLPFPIYKDQVAGVSIRRAWNSSGATWSTALRSLMADLKFILAWQARTGQCV